MPKNPTRPAEWQEAVNLAGLWLRVDSARKYGLITGGPGVDVDRCVAILREGQRLGYRPHEAALEMLARLLPTQTTVIM